MTTTILAKASRLVFVKQNSGEAGVDWESEPAMKNVLPPFIVTSFDGPGVTGVRPSGNYWKLTQFSLSQWWQQTCNWAWPTTVGYYTIGSSPELEATMQLGQAFLR